MRILFFGDSITQGFWDTEGGWVERLRRYYSRVALQDLNANPITEVFNLGISGDTSRGLLARVKSETIARKWQDELPVVVVAIGANDGLYEGGKQWVSPDEFCVNIEKIIAVLQPLTEKIVFVGNSVCDETRTMPVSWGDYTYSNHTLESYENNIIEVATGHHLEYVPVFHEFKQKLDDGKNLLEDGLHPNDAGHKLIYDLVKAKLEELLI